MPFKEWPLRYKLRDWQIEFAQSYLKQQKPKSLLVAATGTGKTITPLFTAHLMRQQGISKSVIIISDRAALTEQWRHLANEAGFDLGTSVEQYQATQDGIVITAQSLNNKVRFQNLVELSKHSNWFGIVDEAHRSNRATDEVVTKILQANTKNRFLYISAVPPLAQDAFDAQYRFNTEYISQESIIKRPETKIAIAYFSPSFSVLQRFLKTGEQIDNLTWREFEKLISELLERDGYKVELMRGTKDGGVDVVAVKDMSEAGFFKTLWQAKKMHLKNRVGLSVIRELADTTNEFKASKGIIVTSTYLTRDALARVQRDRYILGKIDRDDLTNWIQKTLFKYDQ